MDKSGRGKFPRLIDDENLEIEIRNRWFEDHKRDHAVYALQGDDFTNAIEAWIRKTFPEHAGEAKSLAPLIWMNRPVIDHQHHVSRSWTGFFKRLFIATGDNAGRWDTESDT